MEQCDFCVSSYPECPYRTCMKPVQFPRIVVDENVPRGWVETRDEDGRLQSRSWLGWSFGAQFQWEDPA